MFKQDTVIHCSIYGRGAVAYEVNVVGRKTEEVAFKGELNPRAVNQDFSTKKRVVGGHLVTYQIFVFRRDGKRELIKTFSPRGK
ncbi:MAG: hypothetical protein KJ950_05900 [Proteobacteria bacterium]|nr:hypothetical protein [Pseudomonadota bacterium]MBU1685744.1 hypothetical protein [Pseudomonadota bacterium]